MRVELEVEVWGGTVVIIAERLVLLVAASKAWVAWDGRLVRQVTVGKA